jgi:hypothetical protein
MIITMLIKILYEKYCNNELQNFMEIAERILQFNLHHMADVAFQVICPLHKLLFYM